MSGVGRGSVAADAATVRHKRETGMDRIKMQSPRILILPHDAGFSLFRGRHSLEARDQAPGQPHDEVAVIARSRQHFLALAGYFHLLPFLAQDPGVAAEEITG